MHIIAIPTYKPRAEIQNLIDKLFAYSSGEIIASCQDVNSSINRNWCLKKSPQDLIIMVDDDMDGFYPGWDKALIKNIQRWEIRSARLITSDREIAPQLGAEKESKGIVPARHTNSGLNVTCSACIAFYRCEIIFDEYYGGSWEDTDFCMQYNAKYNRECVSINNGVQLIHHHKSTWHRNTPHTEKEKREYFHKKWNVKNI